MPTWEGLKSPSNQHFECFLLTTLIVLPNDRLLKHMNLLTVYHYVLFCQSIMCFLTTKWDIISF